MRTPLPAPTAVPVTQWLDDGTLTVRTGGKLRRFLQNSLLVVASLLVLFIVGEVFCRIFIPDTRLQYAVDPEMIARFVPNQSGYLHNGMNGEPLVRINELGLRGPNFDETAKHRILFLGDSFTFGSGVADDQSFVALLNHALGPSVEVVNGGQPGFGMFQMETILKRLVFVVRPELVVVVVWEYLLLRQPLPDKEREQLLKRSAEIKALKSVSLLGTHIYRLFERAALQYGAKNWTVTLGAFERLDGPIAEQYLTALDADSERLKRMDDLVRSAGAKMLIVFWPREGYIDPKTRNISPQLSSRLDRLSTQKGINYFSLEGVFDPYTSELLVIPHDGHPTAFCHCLVAQRLLSVLNQDGYPTLAPPSCEPKPIRVSGSRATEQK
jgi:hypothetical protein